MLDLSLHKIKENVHSWNGCKSDRFCHNFQKCTFKKGWWLLAKSNVSKVLTKMLCQGFMVTVYFLGFTGGNLYFSNVNLCELKLILTDQKV